MERKILAEKGIKGNAVLGIFYMILFVALVIFILCKASLSFYVIFVCLVLLGLAFWCGYFAFHNLRLPKVMLTYDDNGIYINYKNNEFIAFKDILNTYCDNASYRGKRFKHGYLDISTVNGKYKLGIIANLQEVENIIKSNVDRVNQEY